MVNSVAVVLTKSPYGDVDTVEGLRAASSIAAFGIDTTIVFMEDSVVSLTKNHKPELINMASVHGSIRTLMGCRLIAVKEDLEERGLSRELLLDDVELEVMDRSSVAKLLVEVDAAFTM
ncbi:MAG: hypothetical protein DRJ68_00885 [Thermoprotei archaeon]|nr:MAG: hypothetical protein DRJ68_00885 [Thermoprotei archaeon]